VRGRDWIGPSLHSSLTNEQYYGSNCHSFKDEGGIIVEQEIMGPFFNTSFQMLGRENLVETSHTVPLSMAGTE
jgi:hypothetical protein